MLQANTNALVAKFTKQIDFDTFGRIKNETSTAEAHNKSSSKTITHTYKSGMAWQILDGTNVKWQTNTVDQRGQLLNASLGNGVVVDNKYDVFGYNIENKHNLGTTNIMTLKNVFDPVLANLSSRYNSMFNKTENYKYDTQDRLVQWEATEADVIYCTFTNTIEGFSPLNNGGWSTIAVVNNKLRVRANGEESGAQKLLTTNANVGDKFRIKAEVIKGTGNSSVFARIVETDPATLEEFVTDLVGVTNNILDADFEVNSYTNITLQFYILHDPNSGNGGLSNADGSGQTLVTRIFTIDNLTVSAVKVNKQDYDNRGRITENEVGAYNYNVPNKPYQNVPWLGVSWGFG